MPQLMLPTDWAGWKRSALEITGHFEDSSDPFGAVTGDFDQQGISLGVLQWNIGSGSLQPMVKALAKADVVALMPTYGAEFWTACTSTIGAGLQIVRSWQNGAKLRPDVRAELKAFTRSASFIDQQVQAAEETARRAFVSAREWSAATHAPLDKALFCWFFDLVTQNGGLKTVTANGVADFIDQLGSENYDDVVCDWLSARTSADAGYRDSWKNADLWRDAISSDRAMLFAASYLRAGLSKIVYRADVLNRKATIALGSGWVHLERHNLKSLLGLP